ncbi:MAG: hypothetical protein IPH08_04115 [Rhodocyclaceae bacterium]|nr:hypothetical protein [Rhodocyclaceae bacterium]
MAKGREAHCDDCNLTYARLGGAGGYFHEEGCPSDWKDAYGVGLPTPCWECGCDFIPEERPNRHSVCTDCAEGWDEFLEEQREDGADDEPGPHDWRTGHEPEVDDE